MLKQKENQMVVIATPCQVVSTQHSSGSNIEAIYLNIIFHLKM